MSILVVGSVAYDTVETRRERRDRQLGGSASYFSLAASHFAPVRVVGVVGDDFRQQDLDLLASRGVDIAGVAHAPGPTFHWSGRYRDDMIERDTLATELGVFEDFRPELPAGWETSPYLFLANIHPALQASVCDRLDDPRLVIMDTMNLWIETTRGDLAAVLRRVDVLLLNDGEARQLSGRAGLGEAAAAIRAMGPGRVVIKKGEHGALYFGPGDSVLAVPALLLPEVVDPTGAGDTFAGGFVGHLAAAGAGRDSDERVFRRAMLSGTAMASFCPQDFSVDGLCRLSDADFKARVASLQAMMTP
jgi:sugar/nucleoside kinase (ribokinase family)